MNQVWTEWKEAYHYYSIATELNKKSEEVQAATLIATLGQSALRVINNLGITDVEKKVPEIILDKLTAYFAPSRNKTYERCQFHRIKQQQTESFEEFLQRLQCQVKRCGYNPNDVDEFVMDQIVVRIKSEQTRQRLWVEEALDLEKAKKICRAAERAEKEINTLQYDVEPNTLVKINKIQGDKFQCGRCDTEHGRKQCPAFTATCNKCSRKSHFAVKCRSKQLSKTKASKSKSGKSKSKKVTTIKGSNDETESEEDSDYEYHASIIRINKITADDKWTEKLQIGNEFITVNLDTGAECNVMSFKEAKRLNLETKQSPTKRIITYNNGTVPIIGEVKTVCKSPKTSAIVKFKIIDKDFTTILDREMCEKLGLIIQVQQIGRCKTHEYEIDFIDDPKFKIMPLRRIPQALKNRVKEELDKMVAMKVIELIKEPSPAVSPLIMVRKGNDNHNIRICMDPTELNKNIKRRHYPLKTVEEIAAKVSSANYFTKLDCNKGFWQISVTEKTSKFLAIATPWGKYRYLRLPFGISSAPEVFSQIMNDTLQGIENCEIAMDDIFLFAKTKKEL
ncbi:hypothetical protein RF55_15020 [Lasius niger]|uniref:Reverse transcriptase domain-containing protein n=1 Tax=Lasius niger TaxID=67767 RepID=A0A0J7K7F0_LASNI|nr:hypothetical protein RF55_15020 [Lasius niger]